MFYVEYYSMLVYDFEVFKYDWMVVFYNTETQCLAHVINDVELLRSVYNYYKNEIFIGFNSRNYDVPIFQCILCGQNPYDLTQHIIADDKKWFEYEGSYQFKEYPINNYDVFLGLIDNGLKTLEAYMGMQIEESSVAFDIDRPLTEDELKNTLFYCESDVLATYQVFLQRYEIFQSYVGLLQEYSLDNHYLNKTRAQLSAIVLKAQKRPVSEDEFDITFVPTLNMGKYQSVLDWFKNSKNKNYESSQFVKIAGVFHKVAWGGLHSFIGDYKMNASGAKFTLKPIDVTGNILNADVASYYPNLIKRYNFMSRAVPNPDVYNDVIAKRIEYKKDKNPIADSLKIVLNSTYGAMKDKFSPMYDPLMANNVCVNGQLLLIDLIDKIEDYCDILNSNTDGIIVLVKDVSFEPIIREKCNEWSKRTGMELELDSYSRLVQRDVNSYLAFGVDGSIKSKGALKELHALDNNLAIINKAIKAYFISGVHPRITILENNNLLDYMAVVKLKGKYKQLLHMRDGKMNLIQGKYARVFASINTSDGIIGRGFLNELAVSQTSLFEFVEGENEPSWKFYKFANTPDRVYIDNSCIKDKPIPDILNKQWYIDFACAKLKNEWNVDLSDS